MAQPGLGHRAGSGSRTRSPARPGLFSENTIPDLGYLPLHSTRPTLRRGDFGCRSLPVDFSCHSFPTTDLLCARPCLRCHPCRSRTPSARHLKRRTIRGLGVDPRSIRHFLDDHTSILLAGRFRHLQVIQSDRALCRRWKIAITSTRASALTSGSS